MRQWHALKTWPAPFELVALGAKRHEVRRFDRAFLVGDVLLLREWNPLSGDYTGRRCVAEVTCITPPGTFGLPAEIGVMSIEKLRQWQCSGCQFAFAGRHEDTCPCCARVGYGTGSVHPSARFFEMEAARG